MRGAREPRGGRFFLLPRTAACPSLRGSASMTRFTPQEPLFFNFLCAKAGMHMGVWLRMCSELSPLLDGAQEKLNIYSESLEGAPSFAFPCCTMACGRGMDIQHRLDAVAALTLGLKLKYNLHQTTWHFFSSSTEARIWCGAA